MRQLVPSSGLPKALPLRHSSGFHGTQHKGLTFKDYEK